LQDIATFEMDFAEKAGNTGYFNKLKNILVEHVNAPSVIGYKPTIEQGELLDAGDYKAYWMSVYGQSGGVIGRTEMIGWGMSGHVENVTELESVSAAFTWARMEVALSLMGDAAPTMDQLGLDFAKAHFEARSNDEKNVKHLLSRSQIAEYHFKVLDEHGIGRKNFGGTMLSGTTEDVHVYGHLWAPNADVDDQYAIGLFPNWVMGTGRTEVFYGNDTIVSKSLANSQLAKDFEYLLYDKYSGNINSDSFMYNVDLGFGPRRFVQDLFSNEGKPNAAAHKIGSFQSGYAVVEGDHVHFRVTNTMGLNSFSGGRLLEYIGLEGFDDITTLDGNRTSMSNIDMTIQWSTKIKDVHSEPWYGRTVENNLNKLNEYYKIKVGKINWPFD
jgi:hypothetical protein